jgi:hypothetical protein
MNRFAKACFMTSSKGVEGLLADRQQNRLVRLFFFTRVFNFRYVEFSILGCTF